MAIPTDNAQYRLYGLGDANAKIGLTSIGVISGEIALNFGLEIVVDDNGLVPIEVKAAYGARLKGVKPQVTIKGWKHFNSQTMLEALTGGLFNYTVGEKETILAVNGLPSLILPDFIMTVEGAHFPYSTAVVDEVIGSGDVGGTKVFSGTLINLGFGIQKGSIIITATVGAVTKTITDNERGVLSGDTGAITGTIDYLTGAWTLSFTTAPDNATDIEADYSYWKDYRFDIECPCASIANIGNLIQSPSAPTEPELVFDLKFDPDNTDKAIIYFKHTAA